MTPAAQIAAAIDILDLVEAGQPAEQALTRWARGNRYAGSKDRAAIRDHVFDVLRCWRSSAHLGGGPSGRQRMIGKLRRDGVDPALLFTGEGYAPKPLSAEEAAEPSQDMPRAIALDLNDWLLAALDESLGADKAEATARALQCRAPVTLRVNIARNSRDDAAASLARDGVLTIVNTLSPTALTVTEGPRRLRNSTAYREGLVELQDASSQAVVDAAPSAARILDFCAGGGGKALALAARGGGQIYAHDVDPARMGDLPARAARAGVDIQQVASEDLAAMGPFGLVLVDAPCSGSGAWRRAPEGKLRLTPERLDTLSALQDDILDQAQGLVAPDGTLVYATCSVFHAENEARIVGFLDRHPEWSCTLQRRFDVDAQGDGFFTAHLTRLR